MQEKNQPEEQNNGNYPKEKEKLETAKKAYENYMTMKRNNIFFIGTPEGKNRKGQKAIMLKTS